MENKEIKSLLTEKVITQMRVIRRIQRDVEKQLEMVRECDSFPWDVEYGLSQSLVSFKEIKSRLWSVIGALTDYDMVLVQMVEEKEGAKDE